MLVIRGFNTDFLSSKKKYYRSRYSKSVRQNTEDMARWILNTLKTFVPHIIKGYKYNSQALHLNNNNLEKILKHVDPMHWLNYSPTTDDSLRDDELGVELNDIIIKDK
jgi:hypothetical protein